MELYTLLYTLLVINAAIVIVANGAPLANNESTNRNETVTTNNASKNDSMLSDMTQNALMSSLPILRLLNSNQNFKVNFKEPNSETTPTLHIIHLDIKKKDDKSYEDREGIKRFSNAFDSILSGPYGDNLNFGDKTKSKRIYPTFNKPDISSKKFDSFDKENTQHEVKDIVVNLEKVKTRGPPYLPTQRTFTEPGKYFDNGSSRAITESESEIPHTAGHDSVVSQGHEESKNRHELHQTPSLNVTAITDVDNNNRHVENNGKYYSSRVEGSQVKYNVPNQGNEGNVYGKNIDNGQRKGFNTVKDQTLNDNKKQANSASHDDISDSRNGLYNLDIFSKIAEIENVLNVSKDNSDAIIEKIETVFVKPTTIQFPHTTQTESSFLNRKSYDIEIKLSNNTRQTQPASEASRKSKEDQQSINNNSEGKIIYPTNSTPRNRGRGSYRHTTEAGFIYDDDLSQQNYPRETIEKLRLNKLSNIEQKQTTEISQGKFFRGRVNTPQEKIFRDTTSTVQDKFFTDTTSVPQNKIFKDTIDTSQDKFFTDTTSVPQNKIFKDKINTSQNDFFRDATSTTHNKFFRDTTSTMKPISDGGKEPVWIMVKTIPPTVTERANNDSRSDFDRKYSSNRIDRQYRNNSNDTENDSKVVSVLKYNENQDKKRNNKESTTIFLKQEPTTTVKYLQDNSFVKPFINPKTQTVNEADKKIEAKDSLDSGVKKVLNENLAQAIIHDSNSGDFVLETEESSYYGSNQNTNTQDSVKSFTQQGITVAPNSYKSDLNLNTGTSSVFNSNRNGKNPGDKLYSNLNTESPQQNIKNERIYDSKLPVDLNNESLQRGSRKFSSTKFETISPYITDSDTNKLYETSAPRVKSNIYSTQSLIVNDLSEPKISKDITSSKPYRGSIKYKYEPLHYDWDSGELGEYPDQFGYMYKAPNDTDVYQKGILKKVNNRKVFVVHGSYKYTAPDGTPILVSYTADEYGFHPQESKLFEASVKKMEAELHQYIKVDGDIEEVEPVTLSIEPEYLGVQHTNQVDKN